MLIQDRVKLIIKADNETSSSFADKIGVKRSNLSHVLSGRNKPSLDFLAKVIDYYPKVNASWLITGTTRDGDFKASEPVKQGADGPNPNSKDIDKIVVFYVDGTFSPYSPS